MREMAKVKTLTISMGCACAIWTVSSIMGSSAMPPGETGSADAYATLFFTDDAANASLAVASETFSVARDDEVSHELGLGEEIEGKIAVVEVMSLAPADVVLQFQWETSLSIDDEGPHLDLLDWKHYTSDWIQLPRVAEGGFRVPQLTSEQQHTFPETRLDDVCTAAERLGGARWVKVCRKATAVGVYPTRIGVSAYRFRVGTSETTDWGSAPVIELRRPLGS
jgi:hypothetical protein